jgi:hydrogenase nickel incorporation protein HypA/HybF
MTFCKFIMHELSLAQNLTQQLLDLASAHRAQQVLGARLAVGANAGVVIDSLRFGFEILCKEQPILHSCTLNIEERPAQVYCLHCGALDAAEAVPGTRSCPRCGGIELFLRGGDELTLLSVELDLPPEPSTP